MRRGQAGGVKGMLAMLAVALVAAAAVAPLVGAQSGGGGGQRDDKLLFFASDGLRQDAVEEYAAQGVVPGFGELLATGRGRPDNGLLTQAPPNTGGGLVHARHRRVAGGARLDEQHVPHQRPAVRQLAPRRSAPACCRPRRSPRRPSAAARRSPRSSGPAGAAARSTARRSTSATSAPAAAWRRTTSRRRTRRRSRVLRSAVRPSGRLRRQRAVPRRPHRRPATGWTNVPQSFSPAKEMRLRVIDVGDRQVRPQRLHLRQPQRRPDAATTASCSRPPRTATTRSATSGRAVGRRQGHDQRRQPLNGKTGGMLVKVERLDPRPLAGPPVPHVGDARDRDAGRRGRASRASPATSRTSSPSASRRRRPATSPSSRPGIVSEDTYIEQGLYWERPITR